MDKTFIDKFLSENEQIAIERFNGDEIMREAVKKLLLAGIYNNGTMKQGVPAEPTRNMAFGTVSSYPEVKNEELGAELRAIWQGVNALALCFDEIKKFVPKSEKVVSTPNKAR